MNEKFDLSTNDTVLHVVDMFSDDFEEFTESVKIIQCFDWVNDSMDSEHLLSCLDLLEVHKKEIMSVFKLVKNSKEKNYLLTYERIIDSTRPYLLGLLLDKIDDKQGFMTWNECLLTYSELGFSTSEIVHIQKTFNTFFSFNKKNDAFYRHIIKQEFDKANQLFQTRIDSYVNESIASIKGNKNIINDQTLIDYYNNLPIGVLGKVSKEHITAIGDAYSEIINTFLTEFPDGKKFRHKLYEKSFRMKVVGEFVKDFVQIVRNEIEHKIKTSSENWFALYIAYLHEMTTHESILSKLHEYFLNQYFVSWIDLHDEKSEIKEKNALQEAERKERLKEKREKIKTKQLPESPESSYSNIILPRSVRQFFDQLVKEFLLNSKQQRLLKNYMKKRYSGAAEFDIEYIAKKSGKKLSDHELTLLSNKARNLGFDIYTPGSSYIPEPVVSSENNQNIFEINTSTSLHYNPEILHIEDPVEKIYGLLADQNIVYVGGKDSLKNKIKEIYSDHTKFADNIVTKIIRAITEDDLNNLVAPKIRAKRQNGYYRATINSAGSESSVMKLVYKSGYITIMSREEYRDKLFYSKYTNEIMS